jgi:acetyltransferase-like isoleucine patch superfamily enzyme
MEKDKYHETAVIVGEPKIGKGTWIGPFTLIDGSGDLEIGTNCDISAGVHIYTHSSAKRCVANKKFNEDSTINRDLIERKPVKIGDNAFIGANSTIMMGVTIGKQCIVGSGSIVTKDIPDLSVAMGTPAKVVAKIEIDENGNVQIQKLEK